MTFDFGATTQFGENFAVNAITQDGYTTGRLIGMDIDANGVVQARFTNGRAIALGQVAMANFSNPQGLQQLGDTAGPRRSRRARRCAARQATRASV